MSIGDQIAIFGLVSGVAAGLLTAIAKYGKARELIYANKRDLEHAKNNAVQANKALIELEIQVNLIENDLVQCKTILQMLLAERGQTASEILGYKARGNNVNRTG